MDTMDALNSEQRSLGWGIGAVDGEQLSKQATTPALTRLYHLLLFTLPGTPVFTYGDEIGLQSGQARQRGSQKWFDNVHMCFQEPIIILSLHPCVHFQGSDPPKMIWDIEEPAEGEALNETLKAENKKRLELREWFISLSDLRGKERSLLHGDYYSLHSSATSLAFLRLWDQSERYITAVNWGTAPETFALKLASTGKCRATPISYLSAHLFCWSSLTLCLCPCRRKIAWDGQSEGVNRWKL